MAMPAAGQPAPEFEARGDDGNPVRLSDLRGKPVVLYFYPRDDTPGCTTEACAFRDDEKAYHAAGVVVLGASPDSVETHRRFKAKYNLPFVLLADPDHRLAEAYGVWGEKKRAGKTTMGIHRTTFLIGADGIIRQVFENVRPEGHSGEILGALSGA
jgi:peroxiredoxin Q/BCP